MNTYKIGNINIAIDGYNDPYVEKSMKDYISAVPEDIHAYIDIKLTDHTFPIPEDNILARWKYEMWTRSDAGRSYYIFFPDVDGAVIRVDYDENFKYITINAYDIKTHLGLDDTTYLFNTLTHVFHFIALKNGALVYHSSAISYMGEGVAFSADSGVGKSTHTSLWIKHISGSEYINDDTPLICEIDGRLCICGSPFAGSSGINKNICVPIRAIVFINRAKENSIDRLSTAESFRLLLDQVKTPFDDEIMNFVLSSVDKILKSVPVYRLNCNMEPEAAFTSKKIFEENI